MKELNHESVLSLLPDREVNAHKGNFGKILLLCGSCGYTGAAYLAAMGLCAAARAWCSWACRKVFMPSKR